MTWSARVGVWLLDGALLALFMGSLGVFVPLIEAPGSVVHVWLTDTLAAPPVVRRALIGAAMGLTVVALVYSPWGRRSGAHMNPAVTLTFLSLGKIRALDAVGYIAAQVAGGVLGMVAIGALVGPAFTAPPVAYAATVPGPGGPLVAFGVEVAMTLGMMSMVLWASNSPRWAGWTGVFAGCLVFTYITLLAPLSGMSLNPARTLASAVPSGVYTALWVYLVAPVLGMGLAARLHRGRVGCCKLNHDHTAECIHCGHTGPLFDATPRTS